jgi:hypothetical protein
VKEASDIGIKAGILLGCGFASRPDTGDISTRDTCVEDPRVELEGFVDPRLSTSMPESESEPSKEIFSRYRSFRAFAYPWTTEQG